MITCMILSSNATAVKRWFHRVYFPDAFHFSSGCLTDQSERDCGLQPRVARNALPWDPVQVSRNPNGIVAIGDNDGRNPFRVLIVSVFQLVPRNPGLRDGIPLGFTEPSGVAKIKS
jgi:hypothetical protein